MCHKNLSKKYILNNENNSRCTKYLSFVCYGPKKKAFLFLYNNYVLIRHKLSILERTFPTFQKNFKKSIITSFLQIIRVFSSIRPKLSRRNERSLGFVWVSLRLGVSGVRVWVCARLCVLLGEGMSRGGGGILHGCPLLGKTYNMGEEGMDLCKIIEKLISIYSTLIPTTKRARKNYTPPPNIKKKKDVPFW